MWFCKNEKILLVEILSGMIDIHSHILCGVDDGSKNIEQTRAIICKLKEYGINQSFATPHIISNAYDNSPENLIPIFNSTLLPLVKELDFEVRLAAEYMLDEGFSHQLNSVTPLLTYDGKHLLVELPSMAPTFNFHNLIQEIQDAGYIPILAHPERYAYMTKDDLRRLKSRGVLFQVNLPSLVGSYGRAIAKNAYSLLDSGIFDFIATDIHNISLLDKLRSHRVSIIHSFELQRLINNNNKLWK